MPGSEFLGKRVPGSEFLGKRAVDSESYEDMIEDGVAKIAKRSPETASPLMQSDRDSHLSHRLAQLAQEALDSMDN